MEEEMVEVRVAIRCHFTSPDGGFIVYEPGTRKMPQSHAAHWFVAQHLENPPPAQPPAPGSAEQGINLAREAQIQKERAVAEKELMLRLQRKREIEEAELALRQNMGHIKDNASAVLATQLAKDAQSAIDAQRASAPAPVADESASSEDGEDEPPTEKPKGRVKLKQGK